jgi:hypothetical protein
VLAPADVAEVRELLQPAHEGPAVGPWRAGRLWHPTIMIRRRPVVLDQVQ